MGVWVVGWCFFVPGAMEAHPFTSMAGNKETGLQPFGCMVQQAGFEPASRVNAPPNNGDRHLANRATAAYLLFLIAKPANEPKAKSNPGNKEEGRHITRPVTRVHAIPPAHNRLNHINHGKASLLLGIQLLNTLKKILTFCELLVNMQKLNDMQKLHLL